MKLLLFSDLYSLNPSEISNRLIDLIGAKQPTVGYISSCPDPTRTYYKESKKYYSQFPAILSSYIDLEEEYNSSKIELIFQSYAIHLSGGNTYRFLYWINKRGLQQRLKKYVKQGGVLIGVSAGSILMTPNITSSSFCGDKNNIGLKNCQGLNLIDFHYVPHVDHCKTVAKEIIKQSKQDNTTILVASDRDWVIVDGTKFEVYGKPRLVVNGVVKDIVDLTSYLEVKDIDR